MIKNNKNKKILIAEDNEINQKLIQIILNKLSLEYDFVSNGEDVIKLYDPEKYDLILMDLHMPIVDGFDASKKIKENYPGVKIVAISAESFPETLDKCKESGIDDFITKPFHIEDIKRIINKYAFL